MSAKTSKKSRKQKPKGLEFGAPCPLCTGGRLIPETTTNEGSNKIYGPGGRSWSHTIVSHLSCDNCCVLFKARQQGLNVDDHLLKQAKRIKRPKKPAPKCCENCEGPLRRQTSFERDELSIPGSGRGITTAFDYCPRCLIVANVKVEDHRDRGSLTRNDEFALTDIG